MFLIYRLFWQWEKSEYLSYVFNISTVCWGSRECEIQINLPSEWSVELQDPLWDIPGARQELEPGDYEVSVQSGPQQEQIPNTSQGHVGRVLKSFAKRLQAGPWKMSCTGTWIQNPEVLWFDRDTSTSVATFILFDVRMWNSSSHGRWKSPEFLPFLLCLTQGLGLSTHTKWENCHSAWLPSLNEGDKTSLLLLSFKDVAWDSSVRKVNLALNLKSDTLTRITDLFIWFPHCKDYSLPAKTKPWLQSAKSRSKVYNTVWSDERVQQASLWLS